MVIDPVTQTLSPPDTEMAPGWLRDRYSVAIEQAQSAALEDADRRMEQVGIVMDRRIRAILTHAGYGTTAPTIATVRVYQRDHAHMMAAGQTPLDKASTFQHFNRLRSGFRYGELEAIATLRRQAEIARRAKCLADMRRLTREAFERAAIFEAMFLADDHPVWSQKSASLRDEGARPTSKSKRSAGRHAPTPDQLLVALGNQRQRASRVDCFAACFALFGIRPAELMAGVQIIAQGEGLRLVVKGAKVDAQRGQERRELDISPTRLGQSELAVKVLRAFAAEQRDGHLKATAADVASVRRAMRAVQSGLSPYAYRHARASDAKAAHGREGVAQWLGHATDKSQSHYGHGRSSSGVVVIKGATANRAVRAMKTLPPTLTQQLVRALSRLQSRPPIQEPEKRITPKPAPAPRPAGPR
jgi:hypothetical protein